MQCRRSGDRVSLWQELPPHTSSTGHTSSSPPPWLHLPPLCDCSSMLEVTSIDISLVSQLKHSSPLTTNLTNIFFSIISLRSPHTSTFFWTRVKPQTSVYEKQLAMYWCHCVALKLNVIHYFKNIELSQLEKERLLWFIWDYLITNNGEEIDDKQIHNISNGDFVSKSDNI